MNALWVLMFTLLHAGAAWLFIGVQGAVATYGIVVGLLLLLTANALILRGKEPTDWLRALPLFYVAMLAYVVSMKADFLN